MKAKPLREAGQRSLICVGGRDVVLKLLFFRLNVFQIHLPPLRERTEDIAALAEHFLRRFEPRALPLVP